MSARKIEKLLKGKVKKSKIQEIINYFFYAQEFCEWLENQSNSSTQPLNGQFKNRWEYILKFDEYIYDEISDATYLQEYLNRDNI